MTRLDPVSVSQLGYIGIGVSDLDAWRGFARDLGLEVSETTARGTVLLRMDEYHYRFELYPSGEDDLLYAGWEAKDAAAMAAIAEQIRGEGVEIVEGTAEEAAERMVLGLVKFRDPSGVAMEVYHGPYIDHVPLSLPRGMNGFHGSAEGLGHIVLLVEDLDESIQFYERALGARMSDFIRMGSGDSAFLTAFMHVNDRHHSLAIAAPPHRRGKGGKRLAHFMLEVRSLDDVGYTRSLLLQRGFTCGGYGRHSNDRAFSFYVLSPSGFEIEYGCDGRSIGNEDRWEVKHYSVTSLWGHERPWRVAAAKSPGQ